MELGKVTVADAEPRTEPLCKIDTTDELASLLRLGLYAGLVEGHCRQLARKVMGGTDREEDATAMRGLVRLLSEAAAEWQRGDMTRWH